MKNRSTYFYDKKHAVSLLASANDVVSWRINLVFESHYDMLGELWITVLKNQHSHCKTPILIELRGPCLFFGKHAFPGKEYGTLL